MVISTLVKRSAMTLGALSLIGFASIGAASPTYAAVMNGDFETGNFSGWDTIGSTSVDNGQASLSANGVSNTDLETFLGLNSGTLNALNNVPATDGSAIKQTVSVNAGDTLSFDWLFKSNDYAPYNDFSFFTIGSVASKLADVIQVGNYGQTGAQTSYTFAQAGTYTVGFGVVNAIDTGFSSAVSVDNVKLASAVPESSSMLGVLAIGAFCAASSLKLKQQQLKA